MRILVVVVILWAIIGVKVVRADHLMCGQSPARTLTVYIEPGVDYPVVLAALDKWNEASGYVSGRPVFALWNGSGNPDVRVQHLHYTWVWYGCHGNSIVHWDNNPRWITHELGHALGFADHVHSSTSLTGYINPGTQNGYDGIMNYASDVETISYDDLLMLWRWWFN